VPCRLAPEARPLQRPTAQAAGATRRSGAPAEAEEDEEFEEEEAEDEDEDEDAEYLEDEEEYEEDTPEADQQPWDPSTMSGTERRMLLEDERQRAIVEHAANTRQQLYAVRGGSAAEEPALLTPDLSRCLSG
jgi:hypothetical protein